MSASACHPSKVIHLIISKLEKRFEELRLSGLKFWTRPLRECQAQQDAVSKETVRSANEGVTLFRAIIADGVVTAYEEEQMIAHLEEMALENSEGRVIPGSGYQKVKKEREACNG